MTKEEIIRLLETNKVQRGIDYWERVNFPGRTYGLGLTKLKAHSKKIGKDHKLALELWKDDIYDLKIISILVDDPKQVDREQVNMQMKDLSFWMLSHAYCSNLLSKVPFMKELAEEWIESKDDLERRCGYALLYQIAKDDKKLDDSYFLPYIATIEATIQEEENFVKDAMNNAVLIIGQRNARLNERCIHAARKYGKLDIDYGDNSCKPFDVIGNLTSGRIRKKVQS